MEQRVEYDFSPLSFYLINDIDYYFIFQHLQRSHFYFTQYPSQISHCQIPAFSLTAPLNHQRCRRHDRSDGSHGVLGSFVQAYGQITLHPKLCSQYHHKSIYISYSDFPNLELIYLSYKNLYYIIFHTSIYEISYQYSSIARACFPYGRRAQGQAILLRCESAFQDSFLKSLFLG